MGCVPVHSSLRARQAKRAGFTILAVQIYRMGNQQGYASNEGPNPLDRMVVFKAGDSIRLAEHKNGKWVRYNDYGQSVTLPTTWVKPHSTNVIRLSRYAPLYC